MARFYGWTNEEIGKLDVGIFNEYLLAIEPLTARETMLSMHIAVYPDMKKGDRRSFFDNTKSNVMANIEKPKTKPKTTREIAMKLAGKQHGR